ncbi:MAG: hypothetical protein IPM69_16365 [Ignavibacteria bacterium]|nr:hypothetical protein [Ignavibacteria bacterium]
MQPTLSVFFGSNRTFVSAFTASDKGLELSFVDTIPQVVKEDDEPQEDLHSALAQLSTHIPTDLTSLQICLPIENVFVHQFPAVNSKLIDDVKELLAFEIRQTYPMYALEDFNAFVLPLTPCLDGREMMIAVLVDKKYQLSCERAASELGIPIKNIVVSLFSAHAALMYNYPEQADNTVIIFRIQEHFADVSVLRSGLLAYYGLLPLNDRSAIPEIFEQELEKLLSEYIPFVDSAFVYGRGLTPTLLRDISQTLSLPVQRLNAFRMMSTPLDPRTREYCAKNAHLYPPIVGAVLPELQAAEIIRF